MDYRSEREFLEHMEVLSQNFRSRYGLGPSDPWPDWTLDRALVDYGLPRLSELPDSPPDHIPMDFNPAYMESGLKWQRERAAHLLGHVILHGGRRCHNCRTW